MDALLDHKCYMYDLNSITKVACGISQLYFAWKFNQFQHKLLPWPLVLLKWNGNKCLTWCLAWNMNQLNLLGGQSLAFFKYNIGVIYCKTIVFHPWTKKQKCFPTVLSTFIMKRSAKSINMGGLVLFSDAVHHSFVCYCYLYLP